MNTEILIVDDNTDIRDIINDHNGSIIFTSLDKKAKINIKFLKNEY